MPTLDGLHHITALTADAPRNVNRAGLERRLTPVSNPRTASAA